MDSSAFVARLSFQTSHDNVQRSRKVTLHRDTNLGRDSSSSLAELRLCCIPTGSLRTSKNCFPSISVICWSMQLVSFGVFVPFIWLMDTSSKGSLSTYSIQMVRVSGENSYARGTGIPKPCAYFRASNFSLRTLSPDFFLLPSVSELILC